MVHIKGSRGRIHSAVGERNLGVKISFPQEHRQCSWMLQPLLGQFLEAFFVLQTALEYRRTMVAFGRALIKFDSPLFLVPANSSTSVYPTSASTF